MIIAIDFDGTCVTHDYPRIGKDIGAVPVLKELVKHGHQLILWTMRSGHTLDEAVEWFKQNEIPLWGINENPQQTESKWSTSPKAYAQLYIDDAALGLPLSRVLEGGVVVDRAFADWRSISSWLKIMNVIK